MSTNSSQAVRGIQGLDGTSLGGERPKLTVLHQGQLWIAKLQDRGDPPHAPLWEYVAMRKATRCATCTPARAPCCVWMGSCGGIVPARM